MRTASQANVRGSLSFGTRLAVARCMRTLISMLFALIASLTFSLDASAACDDELGYHQFKYTTAVVGSTTLVGGALTAALFASPSTENLLMAVGVGAATVSVGGALMLVGPSLAAENCGLAPNFAGTLAGSMAGFAVSVMAMRLMWSAWEDGSGAIIVPLTFVGVFGSTVAGGIIDYDLVSDIEVTVGPSGVGAKLVW